MILVIIKTVNHIHSSDFSYDGRLNLEKIVKIFKRKSISVIFISEHSETMNNQKMKKLVKKCKNLTNGNFIIIPGIEFSTKEGYHILGLGIEKLCNKKTVEEIIDFINKSNGLSILAHPTRYKKIDIEKIKNINGIEICNFEYDGLFPRLSNIQLLKKVKKMDKKVFAFSGLDFHWYIHNQKILINISVKELNRDEIFKKIKNRNFKLKFNLFSLSPEPELNVFNKIVFFINSIIFDFGKLFVLSIFKFLRKFNFE